MRTWSKEIFWAEAPDPEVTQVEWRSLKRDPDGLVDVADHVRFLTRNTVHLRSRIRFPARDGDAHLAALEVRLSFLTLKLRAIISELIEPPQEWDLEYDVDVTPVREPLPGVIARHAPPLIFSPRTPAEAATAF